MKHLALLVDDNRDLLVILEHVVEGLGYTVLTATNADEAMHAVAQNPELEVMISDVVMPGSSSGIDLAHRVQRLRPGMKIILTSGYLPDLQIPEVWTFLPKPFPAADLLRALGK